MSNDHQDALADLPEAVRELLATSNNGNLDINSARLLTPEQIAQLTRDYTDGNLGNNSLIAEQGVSANMQMVETTKPVADVATDARKAELGL